jgi:hypothetical protein
MKTLAKFSVDEVLPFTGPDAPKKQYITDSGTVISVKMQSLRYQTFVKSTVCVCCGLEGTFFALQRQDKERDHQAHFNLYGLDDCGEPILFTKDHIHPRSAGGKNHLNNMQTMCTTCNALKRHFPLTIEELNSIRLFKQSLSDELTPKQIASAVADQIQITLNFKELNQCVSSQSL